MIPTCAKWHQNDSKMIPKPPFLAQLFAGLRCSGPSWQAEYVEKMIIFCLWTRLGRTRSDMICITHAIRRLYATFGIPFFTFRPFSSISFTKNAMFSIELEVISVVANPEGGNQALSIRIRGRCILTFSSHLIKNVVLLKYYVFN